MERQCGVIRILSQELGLGERNRMGLLLCTDPPPSSPNTLPALVPEDDWSFSWALLCPQLAAGNATDLPG